jgi:hypothetical protein
MENQRDEFERLGVEFEDLFGRPLTLIDCQNLFCETDKYARVVHPDARGVGERTRIKQRFSASGATTQPFFPPKWGINVAAAARLSTPGDETHTHAARAEVRLALAQ